MESSGLIFDWNAEGSAFDWSAARVNLNDETLQECHALLMSVGA